MLSRNTAAILTTLLGLTAVRSGLAQTSYRFTDVGTLAGGTTRAHGINHSGQVTGYSVYTDGQYRAYGITPAIVNGVQTWFIDNGTGGNKLMQLLTLPKSSYGMSFAEGINSSGQVAGVCLGPNVTLPESATIWSASGVPATLTLGTKSSESEGFGLNDGGDVCGVMYSPFTPAHPQINNGTLWELINGKYTAVNLGTLSPYNGSIGFTVNSLRQVAGGLYSGGTPLQPFLWLPAPAYGLSAGMHALPWIPGYSSNGMAAGINQSGVVVGRSNSSSLAHAFIWCPQGAGAALGLQDGTNDINGTLQQSVAWAVSSPSGAYPLQVVGEAEDLTGRDFAFIWDPVNGLRDLNALTANLPAGWTLFWARSVNDVGQIVGLAVDPNGITRGFVLTPGP